MTITFFDCNGSGRRLFEIGSVSEGFGQKKKTNKKLGKKRFEFVSFI